MNTLIIFLALFSVSVAQYLNNDPLAQPTPYSFNYASNTEDGGSSSHQESGDGSGRVSGFYTVTDLEGHTRIVDYVADENGFRATVRTNEPGTANLNSADVEMQSTGDDGGIAQAYSAAPLQAPAAVPAAPGAGVRYVYLPANDPRLAGY